ncbi:MULTISPECIES: amidohydrolase [unclassified Ruegeria]|uniref:amidohydrolase n=1 Tax=unclassified Ruegeria TaxID=2625375 RepID=UPI0014909FEB|nr:MULTISPECIES: amidohydrolase [unclassified Ruegeria]NOD37103.1 amidohydrolase family protein [Ruegeria sp. HKCCD7296]NOE44278.1 amidohydrolase family protein [Ruegeria sp. HKCCD7319]
MIRLCKSILATFAALAIMAADQTSHAAPEASPTSAQSADTVFTNGKIYTVNASQPWAEAVAISGDKFVVVGSNDDAMAVAGESVKVIDLDGAFVMPGTVDLHSHPFITPWYGDMNLSLSQPDNVVAILAEVKAYADANPDKEWILAGQWHLGLFENDAPRKELLDEIIPDRPVALLDQTGHTFWVNSKALELAGIDKDTPSDSAVVIVKDPDSGEPTGTLRELGMQLIELVIPQASAEEYAEPIYDIFDMFLSYGITSQQTAEGHRAPLEALKLLEREGYLHQRVFVSWDWRTTLNLAYTLEDIESQIQNRANYQTELVYPDYVKIFSDGSPGARTSLLIEPYEDGSGFLGDTLLSYEQYRDDFIKFDKMGVGLHIHSIGEGSIRRVIDALEAMKEANGETGTKHKVAHNWMITKDDITRLAALQNVEMDFSPHIPYPHPGVEGSYPQQIGDDRYNSMFKVRSAIDAGIVVGHGSDWLTAQPTPNPFPAIEGFVTRINPDMPEMGALNPDEAITLEQAIAVTTINGAKILGADDKIGSIEPGKFADMIVLDQNLFEIPVTDVGDTLVTHTVLGGEIVYARAIHGNEDVDHGREPMSHFLGHNHD